MNIRLKKLSILLVFAICISIVITGCGKTEEEKHAEEINENIWEVIAIIKKDLQNNTLTLVVTGDDANWEDVGSCTSKLLDYKDDINITAKEKQQIVETLATVVLYQQYFENPSEHNIELVSNIEALEDALGEKTGLVELIH